MDIFGVVVLGFIAGWLASRLIDTVGYGLIGDIAVGVVGYIVVGILGAYVSTWLAKQLLGIDMAGSIFTSIVVALIGAVTLIVLFTALGPARRTLGQIFLGR
ncbi:MAG: GlsB/YeaQ/YmgE family stress response membrane protein [Chloroflexi bacterium]|nr:GlsB/YeaQ/YmgE family stress response membrane protein [Chloroflexota bacterium]MCL5109414.1 GlsB/YeaQ/YmgE family stress response membrane protein [Chloroflexota bacterium]